MRMQRKKKNSSENKTQFTPPDRELWTTPPSSVDSSTQLQRASRQGFNFADIAISTPIKNASIDSIQTKMEVGEANDKYEREADKVASQVVQKINTPQPPTDNNSSSIQQQTENSHQHFNLHSQSNSAIRSSIINRAIENNSPTNNNSPFAIHQNPLNRHRIVQRSDIKPSRLAVRTDLVQRESSATGEGSRVNREFESELQQAKSAGGQALPPPLQRKMGNAIGANFDPVRIHTDNRSDKLSRSIQAKAFTTGNHIFFKKDQYNPSSRSGQELIAHELTHTVQQGGAIQRKQTQENDRKPAVETTTQKQTEQNLPTITPQSTNLTQRSSQTIQRAVGLEIEVPVPIDNLSPENAELLKAQMANYQLFDEQLKSSQSNLSKKSKNLSNYTWWWKIFQTKKKREKLTNEQQAAENKVTEISQQQAQEKVKIGTLIGQEGRADYGTALDKQSDGFRIDVDHDDRVQGKDFPPTEGGGDSLMEIVTYPAETKKDFNQTMDNVNTYLNGIMSQTGQLTKRYSISNYDKIQGIGPFDHPLFPSTRKPRHNLKGSIQANVGIDLRRYNDLIDWYATSDISQVPTDGGEKTQKMYRDIRKHMIEAAKLAREITKQFLSKIVIPDEKSLSWGNDNFDASSLGNFAGFEGWVTHMAIYLRRGMVSGLKGNAKNVVPVLLKTPNDIAVDYGMTGTEKFYFKKYKRGITREILKAIGRGDETEKALYDILIFPEKYKEQQHKEEDKKTKYTIDSLTNLGSGKTMLTGKPIDAPTGVGSRRVGTHEESTLPSVNDRFVGGGDDTRGGMVVEFRNIPGLHDGVESWRKIGLEFIEQADKLNQGSKSQPKLDSDSSEQKMTFEDYEYKGRGSMSMGMGSMLRGEDETSLRIPDLSSLQPDTQLATQPDREVVDEDEHDIQAARDWFEKMKEDNLEQLEMYCQGHEQIPYPDGIYSEIIFKYEVEQLYKHNSSIFDVLYQD